MFPSERVYRIIDGRDVPGHGDREMPVWGDIFKIGSSSTAVKARIDATSAISPASRNAAPGRPEFFGALAKHSPPRAFLRSPQTRRSRDCQPLRTASISHSGPVHAVPMDGPTEVHRCHDS
jgi:hypothetical protein